MDLRRRRGDDPPAPEGDSPSHLGERVCAVWAFEAFAAEIALDDLADHFDELVVPARRRLASLAPPPQVRHPEPRGALLAGDSKRPARRPVLGPHGHE